MKKIVLWLSMVLMVTTLCSGCSFLKPQEKTFTKSGMSITLTDKFYEKDVVNYTATYGSTDVAIMALKEEFSLLEGLENLSLEDYAQLVIENNKKDISVEKKDGLTYFLYEAEANGKTYSYFSCVYKGTDAFWLIQFSTVADQYEKKSDQLITWAKSVTVE